MNGSYNTSAGDSDVPLDAEMYTMQNEDHDIHDRAQHDDDVPVSPQSVQRATETSVQCFSTMSQTTYNLVTRQHVSIQTDIDVLPSPGVDRISTGTQTDESCINDLLDHSFVYSVENDNKTESEESDLYWIPESDNEEQNYILTPPKKES